MLFAVRARFLPVPLRNQEGKLVRGTYAVPFVIAPTESRSSFEILRYWTASRTNHCVASNIRHRSGLLFDIWSLNAVFHRGKLDQRIHESLCTCNKIGSSGWEAELRVLAK